jgi:multidrug efflux pump subunit AcrA (membrane-fusion protein)
LEVKLPGSNDYGANMIAKLKINDASYKDVLLVPSNVIQRNADGEYVLTAKGEKTNAVAQKHMVKVGANYNGRTIVLEGLEEGDKVITFGYTEVVDGQKIEY